MPSLLLKLQRCGRSNCACSTKGELHGPYFWLVEYVRARNRSEKGKYKWKYIGSTVEKVRIFFGENYAKHPVNMEQIQKKISIFQDNLTMSDIGKKGLTTTLEKF